MPDKIDPKIVRETNDFLVLIKPSGLIVHPNVHQKVNTLVDWLLAKYPAIADVGESRLRPGIVHRLDQDVSGLMVIAKNSRMFQHLKEQFQNRQVKKKYFALVFGALEQNKGEITLSVGRSKTEPGKIKIKHDQSGKAAITLYKVIKKISKYSFVDIEIKTGRTHQIRVHFKGVGHSIVGDKLYKTKGVKSDLSRIFLHAYHLGFSDINNKWQQFTIDLPQELRSYLDQLE